MDSQYWNDRYLNNETGWDMGQVSPPLKAYIDQVENKQLRILIPGGGNSYEADYLHQQGFSDVTVLDIAPVVAERLRQRFEGTGIKVVEGDFFVHAAQYDLVLEQTFFCALEPGLRRQYVEHMHRLIVPGGHLAGVLFNWQFPQEGPPFGGDIHEYREIFSPYFELYTMEACYNSHPARQGKEVFINFIPK
ncbi:Thiopurine S-methyltransferase (TPMT) [Chitinophaga jiangningensis]|uniref:Thiopurine S-methyltransferase (TPMT) n=2 Tax=Chitinophaga jiangningensis TaxID=1419482 RepID=A0A1M6VY67_9BACT|nr:Thiopurine S-methyltransferase (TPMT) [Chitinophaga jiangningensis]